MAKPLLRQYFPQRAAKACLTLGFYAPAATAEYWVATIWLIMRINFEAY